MSFVDNERVFNGISWSFELSAFRETMKFYYRTIYYLKLTRELDGNSYYGVKYLLTKITGLEAEW